MSTRYAIVIPSGAADEPIADLGRRTPLETATLHTAASLAAQGRVGRIRTIPSGLAPGGDVGLISLLGYDPETHFTGRAPIEAVARNISIGRDEVAFRCNLVTLAEETLVDATAGRIRTAEAEPILGALNAALADEGVRFIAGRSYRHLAVVRDSETLDAVCTPPHDIVGEAASDYRPRGGGAKRLNRILDRAGAIVAAHDINLVRRDLGETPATAIWLWGQGVLPILPRFRQQYGLRAALIGGVDLTVGLAKLLGMNPIDVPGATGGLDTDYAAKGRAAVEALEEHDLVVVYVEAPAEAAHAGDALAKVAALERIDAHIVAPILDKLTQFDRWRLLIAADHAVSTPRRASTAEPVPFVMAGEGVARLFDAGGFTERAAEAGDLHIERGHELMEYFLRM